MEPLGVRHVWQLPASNVWQDRYLWAGSTGYLPAFWGESPAQAFDYLARKRLFGSDAIGLYLSQHPRAEEDYDAPFSEGGSELSSEAAGVEGIDTVLYYSLKCKVGNRALTLWWGGEEDPGHGLYAVSDGFTPSIRRLTSTAKPRALSADGRTLFFERDNALWRLDLRRPLPELLDEAAPPPLPEPPL